MCVFKTTETRQRAISALDIMKNEKRVLKCPYRWWNKAEIMAISTVNTFL